VVKEKKATAGPEWFNLPKTELTPELRRDLKLLKMRDVIDPKRFYKKNNKGSEVPEYSQIGTIVVRLKFYLCQSLRSNQRTGGPYRVLQRQATEEGAQEHLRRRSAGYRSQEWPYEEQVQRHPSLEDEREEGIL
jgi:hypothetical protein